MSKNLDTLYEYFEFHLFSLDPNEESEEKFVIRVVENYIKGIESKGHLLLDHADEIRDDLQDEVMEMLLKKTYGFFSIQDFRDSTRPPKKCS